MFIEIVLVLTILLFIYHHWSLSYWKRRNIFYISGELIFGSIKDVLMKKRSFITFIDDLYKNFKSQRIIGFYALYKPMLLLTDTEIIKNILVRDFNSFSDNGFYLDEKVDPMFGINPFCVKGMEKWKAIRGIQIPMQTSFKLKEMIPLINKVGKEMIEYISNHCSEPLEVKELTSMYTIDNVASCAYGLQPSAFLDPENGFKKHATTTLFTVGYLNNIAALFFPFVGRLLSLRIVSEEAEHFFLAMVKSILSFRNETVSQRNDLIDHLIKLNQKKSKNNETKFTDLELAGHCVTFYLDGYETSSSALGFLLLELSNDVEIQERLRREIVNVGCKPSDFDFERLHSLSYLDMVINESLRKYPLLPILSRTCTHDTMLDGIKVSKGTKVFIPVLSLHKDPEFFPNPDMFNPERFSEDNKDSIIKYSYLPFGDGPRTCVGSKFALLQLKLALIFILLKFMLLPESGEMKKDIRYDNSMTSFVVAPKTGSKIRFVPL